MDLIEQPGTVPAAVTVTDRIHRWLYDGIVELRLPPGRRLTELEIAEQLEVSRQPVRDAFYRLSQQGFLLIRPQRATVVSPISADEVMQASFVRSAIEVAVLGQLVAEPDRLEAGAGALDLLLEGQRQAVALRDRAGFHELDDALHRTLFGLAGRGHAWRMVTDIKAHMDRVRFISLEHGQERPFADHLEIVAALRAGDAARAGARMKQHLQQIAQVLERAQSNRPELF